ncbi:hypothetical protein JX580_05450 [Thiomicrospira microaerophila]|uniref:type II toxin-antitoxin system HicB family antitoxin n=1 Tax=Thiomicrospira microaerophila TaxID=406020 RepID=UPI00200F0E88|nr:hypothetical protein [Thiomicrospira microaerophila]UQB43315.1 hypothetical protein JX580_05450 [Thiomicrospira microaerophila]
MQYAMNLEKEGDILIVTFPDIPEALTEVHKGADLQAMALDALESALDFYPETKRPIPLPSKTNAANGLLIPTALAAKIHLYNAWLASGQSKTELATKVGVAPSNLNRLFDFKYRSKIEAIEAALHALGKHFELQVA